ncbi:TPA: hypothetical protein HNW24_04760 [Escherichia coli]|nr:hypothetical protein [Escherichia coli]
MTLDNKNMNLQLNINEHGVSHRLIKKTSNKLLVFFSGTDKKDGRFDFWKSADELPYNILLINNGKNEWYQDSIPGFSSSISETIEKIKYISEQLGCDEIITIGVSMGGYAASLFGALLDCRVLAFSFDTVLKYPLSRSAKRIPKKTKIIYNNLRPIIKNSKCRITALSGEMDFPDLLSLSRISDLKNVKAYSVRGVTHGVGRFIDKRYGMPNIITFFVENNTLPEIKEINNLCHNKILSKNIFLSYQAFVNKDFSTAQSLIREALLAEPLLEPAIFISALVNMELKNYTLAVEQFAFVAGISPHFTTAKYNLAKSLRMSKKYDQAIQHFYEYISLMPSSAGSYYNLSLIYERKGLLEDAKKMAQMAYSLSPESETYKKRYETYFS